MKNLSLILLLLLSINTLADQDFDKLLGEIEAHHTGAFFDLAKKKNVDACEILRSKFEEHTNNVAIQVRVFYYLSASQCDEKITIIRKGLNSKKEIIVINSLRLLKKVKRKDKKQFEDKLNQLAKKYKSDGTISLLVIENLKS